MQRGRWDIRYAVDQACRVSAHVIQEVGCRSAIPWRDEVHPPQQLHMPEAPTLQIDNATAVLAAQDPPQQTQVSVPDAPTLQNDHATAVLAVQEGGDAIANPESTVI